MRPPARDAPPGPGPTRPAPGAASPPGLVAGRPLPHLTYDVDTGPEGPEVAALFDLDGTLVAGFSVAAFLRDRLGAGRLTLQDGADLALAGLSFRRGGLGFSGMMAAMGRMLRDTPERELVETGRRMFEEQMAALIFDEARALVRAHRERGHTLAVVSAATRYQAEPVARDLGIPHVLCTKLEVKGGRLTGRVLRPSCWGPGKVHAAQRFCRRHGADLSKSYFYSDGYEDLPLLDAVGRPRPTNPDRQLRRIARARSWPTRSFALREPATRGEVARTALLASLLPHAAVSGALAALGSRRERSVLQTCTRLWADLGTALAGIELHVEGREHLATRPALFVFNHSSAIDPLLVCRLLRADFAVLARPGARETLPFRVLSRLADGLVADEPVRASERRALVRAAEPLRRGRALVSAPETTHAPSPRLAAFRTGPFRVALEAGAPVVPIVIENASDALPSNGVVVRRARVRVRVLAPIETGSWTRRGLTRETRAVRELFERALASPGPQSPPGSPGSPGSPDSPGSPGSPDSPGSRDRAD